MAWAGFGWVVGLVRSLCHGARASACGEMYGHQGY